MMKLFSFSVNQDLERPPVTKMQHQPPSLCSLQHDISIQTPQGQWEGFERMMGSMSRDSVVMSNYQYHYQIHYSLSWICYLVSDLGCPPMMQGCPALKICLNFFDAGQLPHLE